MAGEEIVHVFERCPECDQFVQVNLKMHLDGSVSVDIQKCNCGHQMSVSYWISKTNERIRAEYGTQL